MWTPTYSLVIILLRHRRSRSNGASPPARRIKVWVIALFSFLTFHPALARGNDGVEKLFGLGDLLAAEGFCGLAYDQAAIRDFIDRNVPPDDLNFAGELDIHARIAKSHLPDMSPATKAAYCLQTERVARHYGFVK